MRPLRPGPLALLGAALLGAGCLGPVRPPDRAVRLDAARVAQGQSDLAASGAAWASVAARQFADAGLTPLADGSFRAGLNAGLVGGLVPGRDPVARRSLVVVGVAASDPEAATVVEAARLLADRSSREVVPEQSVLFVLWEGGQTPRDALGALRRSTVWPRSRVTQALVVGAAPEADGLPVHRLDAAGAASVEGLVAQIARAAERPARAPRADSLAVR